MLPWAILKAEHFHCKKNRHHQCSNQHKKQVFVHNIYSIKDWEDNSQNAHMVPVSCTNLFEDGETFIKKKENHC